MPDEKTKEQNLREQRVPGIDLTENRFGSEEAAFRFFEGLGFTVERQSFMEAADENWYCRKDLTSPGSTSRSESGAQLPLLCDCPISF